MYAAVIVPTLNAGSMWADWISALLSTGIDVSDVYIIDSGSSDETAIKSRNAGFNVEAINSSSFDHGGTRKMAVKICSGYESVIFLTQDAILRDGDSLKRILVPFKNESVAAVCGRQLPRKFATAIEAHARTYNYSSQSCVRAISDKKKYGLKTAFISNSFAAYRVSALNEVDSFPESVVFGEDMYVATKMLKSGYEIAYAADACVYHSHDYSLIQEAKRYFDMGVFHSREPWIWQELGSPEGEGIKFVISEFNYLLKHALWRIPEGMLRTLFRYAGFRLGLMEGNLPIWLKRKLAMNKGFFKG